MSEARRAADGGPRRPDASMTLLTEVMERPLDPGYAAAAVARQSGGPRRVRRRVPVTIVLAVAGGVVLSAAAAHLRLPGPEDRRVSLVEQVSTRTEAADVLERQVEELQGEIDAIQAATLGGYGRAVADRAVELGGITGAAAVTGPGVEMILDDAPAPQDPVAGQNPAPGAEDDGRVVDRDIVTVVNGLWAAGAEAVAVNGHRLTSLAAIRAAGDAILVDFRALAPPYTVAAIGDPSRLQTAFAASAAGRYLASIQATYGVGVSVAAHEELTLPAAGVLRLRYAEALS